MSILDLIFGSPKEKTRGQIKDCYMCRGRGFVGMVSVSEERFVPMLREWSGCPECGGQGEKSWYALDKAGVMVVESVCDTGDRKRGSGKLKWIQELDPQKKEWRSVRCEPYEGPLRDGDITAA